MLFGGPAPRRRKPAEAKEEPKPNTSQDKPKTEAIHKLADVIKQDNSISLQPSGGTASKT